MVAEDAQILLEILLDPSGEILLAVFEKYNKSKFQVVRNTARSFWRNTRKRTEELRILLVLQCGYSSPAKHGGAYI